MNANANLISMAAMMIAVFFAGAVLNGERLRTKELKMELEKVRAEKEVIMQRVEEINQKTYEDEKKILEKIETAYSLLNSLNSQRTLKRQEIEDIRAKLAATQGEIERNVAVINAQTEAGFGLIHLPEDTTASDSAQTPPSQ